MSDINMNFSDIAKATDKSSLSDRMSGGPKKNRIRFYNHETGELINEVTNKVVISGSQFNAMNAFGIKDRTVEFASYNDEMDLDNKSFSPTAMNDRIVCLFCVSDAGCGTTPKDVYTTSYTDRIKPAPKDPESVTEFESDMIMPFRYVDVTDDLNDDLRKYYFGRKSFDKLGKIAYYFKSFDTDPVLHLRYADGTEITPEMYNVESDQTAECYIEMRLRITRLDFRDYFENALGWDKGRISSLSLCFAWYDDTIDNFVYYQDIQPFTLLNFSYQWLVDADTGIDILYDIYF